MGWWALGTRQEGEEKETLCSRRGHSCARHFGGTSAHLNPAHATAREAARQPGSTTSTSICMRKHDIIKHGCGQEQATALDVRVEHRTAANVLTCGPSRASIQTVRALPSTLG